MKARWWLAVLALMMVAAGPAAARETLDLTGQWHYVYADAASPPGDGAAWQPIAVPSFLEWRPEGPHCVWYRQTFTLPSTWRGQRIILRLDAVKYAHRAVLNGHEVGRHVGGYEPAEYDVTDQARFGENTLLVAAQDWTALLLPGAEGPRTPSDEFPSWVKDGIIAPIGSHGSEVGIWQRVSLEARPAVWVDDVFVTTSVRKHLLRAEVTLHNAGPKGARLEVRPRLVSGGPGPDLGAQSVTVPAGGEVMVAFSAPWPKARLWSPQDPHLYVLRVEAGKDARDTRFGFREFWTQGDRLILNGQGINLLATAAHPMPQYDDDPARAYALAKSVGCVAMRLHAQPWPEQWYRVADETGMLLIWESALWCNSANYAMTKDEFWRNAQAHLAAQIKLHRNHPSIVIWSAENELLLCGSRDLRRVGALADTIRGLDPTRPVMFEGDEDPAGKADIINLHYPHEFPKWTQWPETAYWLDNPIDLDSYPHPPRSGIWKWNRKKPLYLGEFLWVPDREVDAPSVFFGDAAYPDIAEAHRKAKALAWEMQVIAARDAGVAGMCPWNLWEMGEFPNAGSEAHRRAYQPIAVFVREPNTRIYAGQYTARTFMVFNDSGSARDFELRWRLAPEGEAWEVKGAQQVSLPAAGHTRVRVPIHVEEAGVGPGVTRARFSYELLEGSERRFAGSQEWKVYPGYHRETHPAPGLPAEVAVYDAADPRLPPAATNMLSELGIACLPISKTNPQEALGRTRVAVVGMGGFQGRTTARVMVGTREPFTDALGAFVRAGGTLIIFEQALYPVSLIPATLVRRQSRTHSYQSTLGFIAHPGHPALRGLEESDFSHWGPGGDITWGEIAKSSRGGLVPLVHTAGERGLDTAALAEVRLGKGRMLLCQLAVSWGRVSDPAAREVVRNLLGYAATPPADSKPTGAVCDDAAAGALSAIGLRYERMRTPLRDADLTRFGQLIICDLKEVAESAEQLRGFVRAGGRVVLHNVTPASFEAVRELLGQPMTLAEGCDGWIKLTDRTGPAAGISGQDLAWFGPMPDDPFRAPSLLPSIADATLGPAYQRTGPEARVEAKAMRVTCPAWGPDGTSVSLYTNGELATDIEIRTGGLYEIALHARGTPADGIYPRMTVSVDGAPVGSVSTVQEWRTLAVVADLSAGRHTLELAFVNDLVSNGEDRNVWVDWVTSAPVAMTPTPLAFHTEPGMLVSLPYGKGLWVIDQVRWEAAGDNEEKAAHYLASLLAEVGCEFDPELGDVVEAKSMAVKAESWQYSGDAIALATAGTLEFDADFATGGRYTFGLLASGTALDGIYPRVEVRVDGAAVGAVDLQTWNWRTYRVEAPVTAGPHHIALAFVNDEWRPPQDRNLSIGRLTIGRALAIAQ